MARPNVKYEIRAVDKTAAGINKATRGIRKLDGVIKGLGAATAGLALGRFVGESIKAADQVNKLSDRLGVAVDDFSRLQFAAEQTGVNFQTLSLGLQRANRRISEAADGTGEAQGALRELGLEAGRLEQLAPEQQFRVIAEALSRVEGQSDKVRLAFKLFDSEGVALLQTLKGGTAELDRFARQSDALGATLDQGTADAATRAVDSVGRMRAQFRAFGQELVTVFGPAIEGTINFLIRSFREVQSAGLALAIGFAKINIQFKRLFGSESEVQAAEQSILTLQDRFAALRDTINGIDFNVDIAGGLNAADFIDPSLAREENELKRQKIALTKEEQVALKALNEDQARAAQLFADTRTPLENLNIELAELDDLLNRGVINWEVYSRAVLNAEEQLAQTTEAASENIRGFEDASRQLANGIVDVFTDADAKLEDILANIAKNIAQAFFQQQVGDPLTAGISGLIGSIFGRANGGAVVGGRPQIVGENGPELFVPQANGRVETNAATMGPTNINFTVNSLDPKTAASVIVENRNAIVGVVRDGINRTGREGNIV